MEHNLTLGLLVSILVLVLMVSMKTLTEEVLRVDLLDEVIAVEFELLDTKVMEGAMGIVIQILRHNKWGVYISNMAILVVSKFLLAVTEWVDMHLWVVDSKKLGVVMLLVVVRGDLSCTSG